MQIQERILRKPDVEEMTGFCERHIRDMEAAGTFPKRFKPDPNSKAVGWLLSEVLNWISERADAREAA